MLKYSSHLTYIPTTYNPKIDGSNFVAIFIFMILKLNNVILLKVCFFSASKQIPATIPLKRTQTLLFYRL